MGHQFPEKGKLAPYSLRPCTQPATELSAAPSSIAANIPPAVRSASVTFPACTLLTSAELFTGSINQTLSSYLSMQALPTRTESGGHGLKPADAAVARQTAIQPTTMYLRNAFMSSSVFLRRIRFPG